MSQSLATSTSVAEVSRDSIGLDLPARLANTAVVGLACRECGREYPITPIAVCNFCFAPIEIVYDYPLIASRVTRGRIEAGPSSIWRYEDLLPRGLVSGPDLQAGWTDLRPAPRLAAEIGLSKLWIKSDTQNPTHSFKDRLVTIALDAARTFGFEVIGCASTGNLANSVAAHAAVAGLQSVVIVPDSLEVGKLGATAIHGGIVLAVDGSYDDVNRLCSELASTKPWAFVNVNLRAYYSEGAKTLAFETVEQLGWRSPDVIVTPVAAGLSMTKIGRGLKELHQVGLLEDEAHTRIYGAQAEGCSPVAQAFAQGTDAVRPVKADTIAKSLAIGNPADGSFAIETARSTGGAITAVPEQSVVEGIKLLARTEGIFTETAGGVTISGLEKLVSEGQIDKDDEVVVMITGQGLKTLEAIGEPPITKLPRADVRAVEDAVAIEGR